MVPLLQKITYANKLLKNYFRRFRVINYAKELCENYSLGSYVNFAQLNMEESEVSAAANYAK